MARLLRPGKLSVHSAASPDDTLSVTLTPTRGELVRVTVEDLRAGPAEQAPRAGGLFPPPFRALALVPMSRVERLAQELQAVLSAGIVPAALAEGDLVLRGTLPLADGEVDVELREEEGAPQLPLAQGLIEDFAVQVAALPETRMVRFDRHRPSAAPATWFWLRPLLVVALIGSGGYLVGAYLQRLVGCAP